MSDEIKTFVGQIQITFEYDQDDIVSEHIPLDDCDDDERDRFGGKTFVDLDEDDLKRAFELAFYDQVERPSEIEFNVEIEEDVR
jgi:hypothetical protein